MIAMSGLPSRLGALLHAVARVVVGLSRLVKLLVDLDEQDAVARLSLGVEQVDEAVALAEAVEPDARPSCERIAISPRCVLDFEPNWVSKVETVSGSNFIFDWSIPSAKKSKQEKQRAEKERMKKKPLAGCATKTGRALVAAV